MQPGHRNASPPIVHLLGSLAVRKDGILHLRHRRLSFLVVEVSEYQPYHVYPGGSYLLRRELPVQETLGQYQPYLNMLFHGSSWATREI